jgi:hypothetical protein
MFSPDMWLKINKRLVLFGLNFTSKLFAQALAKITILSTLPILQRSAKGFVPIDREVSDYKKKCVNCTSAFTWVLMRKKKPVISNTGKFCCCNNNVSNLYNNSVVEKINGMAYIFTLLMFRKLNKRTINKNKTTHFYRSTSFRFSFIFRYFKFFQMKRIVYI